MLTIRVDDREFRDALRRYALLSRRTPAEIVNRKVYMINRRAIWHTKRADAAKFTAELGAAEAHALHINKAGKNKGKFSRAKNRRIFVFGNKRAIETDRRFRAIIVARLRKHGKEIPSGMERLLDRAFKARLRSVAFVASGFIPAREAAKNWCRANGVSIGRAGLPPNEGKATGSPTVVGKPKGKADLARFNWVAQATFVHSAGPTGKRDSTATEATPALARAFAEERDDTIAEIERRLRQNAQRAGIKTN